MDKDNSPCGHALTCEGFKCRLSTKNHHVRLTEKCLMEGTALCLIPNGQACDINKMRRLKNELSVSGLREVVTADGKCIAYSSD